MAARHKLKIKNITRETEDCVSIVLDIPSELNAVYQYKSGQFVTFCKEFNGEELRRSYSICSSPEENELRVAVKKVEDGRFSNYANNELKIGDEIDVISPDGRFTPTIKSDQAKSYLLIAAGSGITPILSILKSILNNESKSTVCLLYGNQRTEEIIFREEILNLKNKFLQKLHIHFLLSKEITEEENFYGRINAEKIKIFNNILFDANSIDEVYICGPEEMTLEVKSSLEELGFDPIKIHFELFGTSSANQKKPVLKKEQIGQHAQIEVKLNGRTVSFDLDYGKQSILDAALKQNLALPYACKGGVCCTCKAKVLQGEVEMLVNYGLEEDEIKNGYVLTCQSYPKSKTVSIDYDV